MNRGAPAAPPRALRRAPWRSAPFVALDFEATGLDPERDSLISFGLAPVDGGRVVVGGAVYREMAPASWPSHGSVPIHQLRPIDLADAPTLDAVTGDLAQGLEGRFLLCWSAGIEAAFLDRVFGGGYRRWLRRTVDVLQMARALESPAGPRAERPDFRLASVAARFGVPVDRAHHALGDAMMTAQLFLVLATRLERERRVRRVRQLLGLTG
jgi:DNA polymerase-3 subunit epsilon